MLHVFTRPIIVIGCHRSGTSWLAAAMHEAGINMGVSRDKNEEAWHFLSLNQQAMANAGGSWDMPLVPGKEHWPFHQKLMLLKTHFGCRQRRGLTALWLKKQKWGWKDPRNTFTLNHWLQMFPRAKVIHLERNREDVAESLLRRQEVSGEVRSAVLDSKNAAYQLWDQYVMQAKRYVLGKRILHLHYEDLIANNPDALRKLDAFCGAKVSEKLLKMQSK